MRLRTLAILALVLIVSGCMGVPDNRSKNKESSPSDANDSVSEAVLDEKTFLLLGVDSRGEASSRSDAILLARYDEKQKIIKLASIMRDSYVEIPGYKLNYNKINMAYYLGGSDLLKKTIYDNFHIKVDHVAIIDFNGFVKLIDLLSPEGIKVDVKPEMIEDMTIEASKGENVLHGEEILKYVRFRHDSESDFGRVKRQQEVLVQLKEKVVERLSSVEGVAAMPHVLGEARSLIDTDIGMKPLIEIGTSLLFNPIDEVETLRIPVEGSYTDETYPHSGAVLELDKEKNQAALQEFIER
ncbi:LCP family protein [Bacillus sp. CECT 9360]|uniref:LCP family protein n=1 Tax=Bacillus sp. CECT 9360 TaxID=2845821 RepID=UPI001E429FBF|nr:LCP family protein [Bacillus sp. CECT 9360]CAH0347330.1 Regulatory protein MsrR [Bacillus sp. CECT 9360]